MHKAMDYEETLLIHLGGLGDMCLSESAFFSLSEYFGEGIVALGYTRFLRLFECYFKRIERVELAKWLPLFSQNKPDIKWKRIVFIGKDRGGALRKKWGKMSRDPMIFIEMYPEKEGSRIQGVEDSSERKHNVRECVFRVSPQRKCHVEDFQLLQLEGYGVEARKREITMNRSKRIILYPEKGFKKEKWAYENFIELYRALKDKGADVYMLASIGLEKELEGALFFEELTDVKGFFEAGGIFVSNDSGMAHLAGMCGLYTVTIFTDFDRDVWHPRGYGIWLQSGKDVIDVPSMESRITRIL